MANKNEAKALLARAGIEINSALRRVDQMSDVEVTKTVQTITAIRAFFDQNGVCGKPSVQNLRAFFDQNGVCGGRSPAVETALKRVLKPR